MVPGQKNRAARLRRLSSQGSHIQLKLLEKSTAGSNAIFGKYAVIASSHPWKLIALGHLLALVFILGIMLAEKTTDINDLWIDTDSRVVDEKKDFEGKFGGPGREIAVALQARGTGGVATETALRAHQSSVEGFFKARITDRGHNFTAHDFCEKPPVPEIFLPDRPTTSVYVNLTQCLATQPVFVNISWPSFLQGIGRPLTEFEPLPSGWGINSFPCSRSSPLDCFQEGGEVDYPISFKLLETVAPGISFAKTTQVSTVIQGLAVAVAAAQAAADPAQPTPPCWLISVPPSAKCILPGSNITSQIPAFQQQVIGFLTQDSGATLPPHLQDAVQAIQIALQSLGPGTTDADLDTIVQDIQAFSRKLDKDLNSYLQLEEFRLALEQLRLYQGDWAFRDAVANCLQESIADFLGFPDQKSLEQVRQLDNAGQPLPAEQRSALRAATLLNNTIFELIDAFATFGYWWRPSYKGMSSEKILEVYKSATESEANSAVAVEQCISGQSQGTFCCLTWDGTKAGMHFFLGNVDTFPNGSYKSAKAYQTALLDYDEKSRLWKELVEAKVNESYTSGQLKKLSERFEGEVMSSEWQPQYDQKVGSGFAPNETYKDYSITFITVRSLSDLLSEGIDVETNPLVISYVAMLAFIIFSLGRIPFSSNFQELIDSHVLLGIYGLFTVALATAAGLGFSAYVQLKFTPITSNLAPFVSLGLGVDDMFVLVQSMIQFFEATDSVEVNMIRCMHLAGPSVFLTSAANMVAFFIMASTPTRVIYLFGISAAINVILNFLMLHLIFVPVIVLDVRRMLADRLDIVPIQVTPTPEADSAKLDKQGRLQKLFGSDTQPISEYVAVAISDMLKRKVVKVCTIIVFVVFTSVMLWSGVDRTTEGLETSDIAVKGTYQHDMSMLLEDNFPTEAAYLVSTSSNFSNEKTQQTYLDCLNSISTNRWIIDGLPPKYLAWYANSSFSLLGSYAALIGHPAVTADTPLPANQFRTARISWLSQLGITSLPNLVCVDINDPKKWVDCRNSNSRLLSAKVGVYFDNLRTIKDYRDVMRSSRKLVDPYKKDDLDVYMIGSMYYFYEQYLHMSDNALRTTGLTLLGVFFITFIFQFSPVLSSLVCLIVAAVVVQLWGMYTYIGVKLNPFSVANLAISVGMAVEFTAHISRAFAIAKGSHDERMGTALKEMMVPMYQGAVSTIIAMAALADAASPFFRAYYCYTYIIMIVIAVVNGLIVLPVLLSLIGPAAFGDKDESAEKADELVISNLKPIAEAGEEKIELGEPDWRAKEPDNSG